MPSANRFAFLRDTVRNHPVIVATTAATGGVLLGAFRRRSAVGAAAARAPTAQRQPRRRPSPTKAAPKPVAGNHRFRAGGRTRGLGGLRAADLAPSVARLHGGNAKQESQRRVISTDKLDKPTITAIEASPPAAA